MRMIDLVLTRLNFDAAEELVLGVAFISHHDVAAGVNIIKRFFFVAGVVEIYVRIYKYFSSKFNWGGGEPTKGEGQTKVLHTV